MHMNFNEYEGERQKSKDVISLYELKSYLEVRSYVLLQLDYRFMNFMVYCHT